jgi:hypothetical protein
MNKIRHGMVCTVLLTLLFGMIAATGSCFPVNPAYTDSSGDQGPDPTFCDILDIRFDEEGPYLQFQINFAAPWNESACSLYEVMIYISKDNTTGADMVGDGFLYDYWIFFRTDGWMMLGGENSSNYLDYTVEKQMSYYQLHNNNHTIEMGYRLRTYYNDAGVDKGYLNISARQTIYIKIYAGQQESDWAPDQIDTPIRWDLTGTSDDGIPGFEWILLGLSLSAVLALRLLDKRRLTP